MLTNRLGHRVPSGSASPVQQYVHAGPGDQVVQPNGAPGRAHMLVGQPIPGAGATLPPGCSFH